VVTASLEVVLRNADFLTSLKMFRNENTLYTGHILPNLQNQTQFRGRMSHFYFSGFENSVMAELAIMTVFVVSIWPYNKIKEWLNNQKQYVNIATKGKKFFLFTNRQVYTLVSSEFTVGISRWGMSQSQDIYCHTRLTWLPVPAN
jgi:hypothetical protein